MFALAIVPLILKLMEVCPTVYQVWFADDTASCERLKQWWDALSTFGPHFGYSPNATKTILVVKDEHEQTANSLFSDTGIKITTHGKRHLGAAIGSSVCVVFDLYCVVVSAVHVQVCLQVCLCMLVCMYVVCVTSSVCVQCGVTCTVVIKAVFWCICIHDVPAVVHQFGAVYPQDLE